MPFYQKENFGPKVDRHGSAASWETIAIESVGNVIEFWGFKRNQGRLWALLFLRGQAMTSAEIQEELALSKGAVSMLVRDLESWNVAERIRKPEQTGWAYSANTNLMEMIARVLNRREIDFLQRVVADLEKAKEMVAVDEGASAEVKRKVHNMHRLSKGVLDAVSLFAKTARLDFRSVLSILAGRNKLKTNEKTLRAQL